MVELLPELVQVHGRTLVKLTLCQGQRILDVDTLNPFSAAQRRRVCQRLAASAGEPLEVKEIEAAVLRCAAQAAQSRPAPATVAPSGRVLRPELFATEVVCGLCVPQTMIRGNAIEGQWRLMLRRSDGTRQCIDLPRSLDVAVLGRLWLHPQPPPPAVPAVAAWSEQARSAWLAGSATPPPRQLFRRLCEALDDYLDLSLPTGMAMDTTGTTGTTDAEQSAQPQAHGSAADNPILATLALWIMLSYCYVAWDAVPYLHVTGPMASGKTRVFELLGRLCFRPLLSSNLSAPALFRTLHERGGTLLMDEAERLKSSAPEIAELRSILLAGYKQGGRASRLESAGENFTLSEFEVFGPKAIACIESLPPALLSRCIPIHMIRSLPDSPKPRRRIDADAERWQSLRDELHALALDGMLEAALALRCCDDVCPLSGRQYELWQPIMALAQWIEGPDSRLCRNLLELARRLFVASQDEQVGDEDQVLLRALTDLLLGGQVPQPLNVLHRAMVMDHAAFANWNPRRVAEALRRYGISAIRCGGRRIYRDVTIEHMKRIETSYGIDLNTAGRSRLTVVR